MASDHARGVDSPRRPHPDDLAASASDEEGVLVADASANGVDGLLVELARRAAIASRMRSRTETAVLQSILDGAVATFRAEAASLALTGRDNTLEFALASGAHGSGVVGRAIGIGEGIAGYVYQTGEPMALAHPASDPRFGRTIAEQTGFLPESILAVPLMTAERTLGVIEILDCRDGAFSAADIELAAVFARQAAIAIDASRIETQFPILLANALANYGLTLDPATQGAVDLVAARSDDDFWPLVEEIAQLAEMNPRMRAFVVEMLAVANRLLGEPRDRRFAR